MYMAHILTRGLICRFAVNVYLLKTSYRRPTTWLVLVTKPDNYHGPNTGWFPIDWSVQPSLVKTFHMSWFKSLQRWKCVNFITNWMES